MAGVIVLELNELTPALMDRFIAEGHLPNFKRLRDASVAAITDAGEDPPFLEPWIQWVTVHTGLPYAEHKVFDLGDGPKLAAPRVWDHVSDAGRTVWICGSMNAAVAAREPNGYVLPDPWATGLRPIPEAKFAPFFDFVSAYVQDYTRDRPPLGWRDHLRFVRFMAGHGLSVRTVLDTLRQLGGEARARTGKWRRAAILDDLLWDVFRAEYRRIRPTLATFFLNSTAHYQHYYWRNHDPDPFEIKPAEDEPADHADAILFGYRTMDRIVGECLALAAPDTSVVLCTALGQQPLTRYDEAGGRQLFKPRDIPALLAFAGVTAPCRVAPVMAEEFRLFFDDEAAAVDAAARLEALQLAGEPVLRLRRTGAELYAGCAAGSVAAVVGQPVTSRLGDASAPFDRLFYPIEAGLKSGMHHREGLLWMKVPGVRPRRLERMVALEEIAPTLLALCDLPAAARFAHPPMAEVARAVERRSAA